MNALVFPLPSPLQPFLPPFLSTKSKISPPGEPFPSLFKTRHNFSSFFPPARRDCTVGPILPREDGSSPFHDDGRLPLLAFSTSLVPFFPDKDLKGPSSSPPLRNNLPFRPAGSPER